MSELIRSLSLISWYFPIAQKILFAILFPKLKIQPAITLLVRGKFKFGKHNRILNGTFIEIGKEGELLIKDNSWVGRHVNIHVNRNQKILLGEDTSIQDRCTIIGDVTIGNSVLFAPNVFCSSGTHQFNLNPADIIRNQDKLVADNNKYSEHSSQPILIEDDCWIGTNAVIMRSVVIAKGSIIGANSVVTKDTCPYSINAGVPANQIGKRLEFKPKKGIRSNHLDDYPYYYSGFRINSKGEISVASSDLLVILRQPYKNETLKIIGTNKSPQPIELICQVGSNKSEHTLGTGQFSICILNHDLMGQTNIPLCESLLSSNHCIISLKLPLNITECSFQQFELS